MELFFEKTFFKLFFMIFLHNSVITFTILHYFFYSENHTILVKKSKNG